MVSGPIEFYYIAGLRCSNRNAIRKAHLYDALGSSGDDCMICSKISKEIGMQHAIMDVQSLI
jgi:hypothetical protein